MIAVRKQKERTFTADSKIKNIGYQNKNIGSQIAMTGALATTSKAMGEINKIMRPEKMGEDLRAFQQANMKMSMTDEMSMYHTMNYESFILLMYFVYFFFLWLLQ